MGKYVQSKRSEAEQLMTALAIVESRYSHHKLIGTDAPVLIVMAYSVNMEPTAGHLVGEYRRVGYIDLETFEFIDLLE